MLMRSFLLFFCIFHLAVVSIGAENSMENNERDATKHLQEVEQLRRNAWVKTDTTERLRYYEYCLYRLNELVDLYPHTLVVRELKFGKFSPLTLKEISGTVRELQRSICVQSFDYTSAECVPFVSEIAKVYLRRDNIPQARIIAETTDSTSTRNYILLKIVEKQVGLERFQDAMETIATMSDSGDKVAISLRDYALQIVHRGYLNEGKTKKALEAAHMMSANGYHQGLFFLDIAEKQLHEEDLEGVLALQEQTATYLRIILTGRQAWGSVYFDNLIIGWNRILESVARIQMKRGHFKEAAATVLKMFTELTTFDPQLGDEWYIKEARERVDGVVRQRNQILGEVVIEYKRQGNYNVDGWNFMHNSGTIIDDDGHGTHSTIDKALAQHIRTDEIREEVLSHINKVPIVPPNTETANSWDNPNVAP